MPVSDRSSVWREVRWQIASGMQPAVRPVQRGKCSEVRVGARATSRERCASLSFGQPSKWSVDRWLQQQETGKNQLCQMASA